MKLRLPILLLFFYCNIAFNLRAQEHPPIEVYTPEIYGGENQNWMLSQAPNNFIYSANNAGLLEYNGEAWMLYPSPNNSILRSVTVIEDRIYTGCYMEFGYWVKNEFGQLKYTSLVPLIKQKLVEDEQIWNIVSLEKWVLFQSFSTIYMLNTDSNQLKIIRAKDRILKIFKVNNEIYYQDKDLGIFKLQDGNPELIIKPNSYNNDNIIYMGGIDKGFTLLTKMGGLYEYKNSLFKKWNVKSNLFSNINVYSGLKLKDGSYLIGTVSQGLIHLSAEGIVLSHLNQYNGISNNTILSLFEDVEGNIWLGLDNGINCVNLKSPLSIFFDKDGFIGTVYTSKIYHGKLYLGTNQGLFYKDLEDKISNLKFINGTNGQVWSLELHDDKLFCGHNLGTFIVDNEKIDLISTIAGTWQIKPIENNKNFLIQGNYSGLSILEKKNNTWSFRNKIKGFDNSARFFEFTQAREIWVNHEYKGVFKLSLDKDYQEFTKVIKSPLLPKAKNSSLVKYKNQIFYAFKEGLLKYDIKSASFIKDTLYSKLLTSDEYLSGKLISDDAGMLWAFTKNEISYTIANQIDNAPKTTIIPLSAKLRKTMDGFENIMNIDNNVYLLGTANGYIKIDLTKIIFQKYAININSIKLIENGNKVINIDINNNNLEYGYKRNSFKFNYSVPVYDKFTIVKYQYKLDGLIYRDWSNWSQSPSVLFENLNPGTYTFNVRAMVGNKLTENVATYTFIINKPWYLTNTALAVYIVMLLILSFIIHKAYNRYFDIQKQRLIDINKKKIERAQLVSEKEIMSLKNNQLRQDIDGKNRELAISTMSLIKKNELLSSLKKELVKIDSKPEAKSVIKIIDKNINNTKDWEFFQEAFNNADKDFLNKVIELHPDLTPNDLKFCAYLRLNLSSKEIAPLLNVSVRSVEIKRYRLRKKMNLPHQKSLVSYILEI
ncbi:MAG: LuxR family transcriptional regulator [Flavobacteriales bacterium CG11_big_fil_rev_8_21_14_0_20_35_7]|nr:MAG: LuxR family transcriptional regulator [Flavobacteriales bacterium CG11_big_fil_rev_8_21_14_0_20_35_7]